MGESFAILVIAVLMCTSYVASGTASQMSMSAAANQEAPSASLLRSLKDSSILSLNLKDSGDISSPTCSPSPAPTSQPSFAPSSPPTSSPSSAPSSRPISSPTSAPSSQPISSPTSAPSSPPTLSPTSAPSSPPSMSAAPILTIAPTLSTLAPSFSNKPSSFPSSSHLDLSLAPTISPTNFVLPPSMVPVEPDQYHIGFVTYIYTAMAAIIVVGTLWFCCRNILERCTYGQYSMVSTNDVTEFFPRPTRSSAQVARDIELARFERMAGGSNTYPNPFNRQ